jgi:hypothetical protein
VALGFLDAGNTVDAVVPNPRGDSVFIYRGDGAGAFAVPTPLMASGPREVAIGDIDGDGDNDLAIAGSTNVYASFNDGNAGFTLPVGLVGSGATGVAIVDTDANGRGDIVATKNDGNVAVVRRLAMDFEAASNEPAGGGATSVSGQDLDADGDGDLVVSNSGAKMTALISRGNGDFDATDGFDAPGNPADSVIGDFNRDGNPDAAVASPSVERVHVFLSRRPQLPFTPANIDFGNVRPGATSDVRTFRLTNNERSTAGAHRRGGAAGRGRVLGRVQQLQRRQPRDRAVVRCQRALPAHRERGPRGASGRLNV